MKKHILIIIVDFLIVFITIFVVHKIVSKVAISKKEKCIAIVKKNNSEKQDSIEKELKKKEEKKKILEKQNQIENVEKKIIKKKEIAKINIKNFDMKSREWFFVPNNKGITPEEPSSVLNIIKNKDAYYVGDTTRKVLYLTFDEGYENGYTPKILDILRKNNIKASFFVTEPYINENVVLLKRMIKEGHIIGNHSKHHLGMDKLATKDTFNNELLSPAKLFKEKTGEEMDKFFRPPMGAYNELSLYKTKCLGFKTIFWSMAYRDYEPEKQPKKEYAKKLILQRTHPGSIMLLHAVSKTNTEILNDLIKEWRKQGYKFKTLNDL